VIDATTIIDYDHSQFLLGIDHIANEIELSGWRPDYIVGIVRGGAVPAVFLSHRLKTPMTTIQWNTRDSNPFGNESNTWIPEDILEGAKVLLVDDIVDGGETICQVITDWQTSVYDKIPLQNIRIAAMYYNTAQDVKVDYYHHAIDRNEDPRWVIFPWEAV
jgi:hypoxanthine phosphoribosyltransferase